MASDPRDPLVRRRSARDATRLRQPRARGRSRQPGGGRLVDRLAEAFKAGIAAAGKVGRGAGRVGAEAARRMPDVGGLVREGRDAAGETVGEFGRGVDAIRRRLEGTSRFNREVEGDEDAEELEQMHRRRLRGRRSRGRR